MFEGGRDILSFLLIFCVNWWSLCWPALQDHEQAPPQPPQQQEHAGVSSKPAEAQVQEELEAQARFQVWAQAEVQAKTEAEAQAEVQEELEAQARVQVRAQAEVQAKAEARGRAQAQDTRYVGGNSNIEPQQKQKQQQQKQKQQQQQGHSDELQLCPPLVVWFNAWQYTSEKDVYAGLAVEVMRRVEGTLPRASALK